MAIVSAFDGVLYADDNHFMPFLDADEDVNILQVLMDALLAQDLQFQEVLKASMITTQMANNMPSSPSVTAVPKPGIGPSVIVNEIGESSLSFCVICNQRKENDQMFRNESCEYSSCLDCISKHVVSMSNDGENITNCPGLDSECVLEIDMCMPLPPKEEALCKELVVALPKLVCQGLFSHYGERQRRKRHQGMRVSCLPQIVLLAVFCPVAFGNITPISAQGDDQLEVLGWKSNVIPGSGAAKHWTIGRGSWNKHLAPKPINCTPLNNGWNCQSRTVSTSSKGTEDIQEIFEGYITVNNGKNSAAAAVVFDDNCDLDGFNDTVYELSIYDFDSDARQKSHETSKKTNWFKTFFESQNLFTIEEINDPARSCHAVFQGGKDTPRFYKSTHPVKAQADATGTISMKLDQELAELLDEKLRKGKSPVTPAGEVIAKWKVLGDEVKDHKIVWPPMVVIMNTSLKRNENNKWTGMGNQELLTYFSSYSPLKVLHSYGPEGHRGASILIFESSAKGFLEAECLHKHFAEEGFGRSAWNHSPVYFLPSGERQLYGYLAVEQDLHIFNQISFNQNSTGRFKVRFEMRSYQEMVMNGVKQMSEDSKELKRLKCRYAQEQSRAEALQESHRIVSEKLKRREEEIRIVRERTKSQHETYKEEVDFLEQFFTNQIKTNLKASKMIDANAEQSNRNEDNCM
ncbi:LOW QUALITY PROTEIN: XS domain-containing protein [Cephalotus follicularis]|uniref:XS domain-containing protein n=1 Tax=Cephalotus follicularis TaxID=3775 RepID=A0A1Q3CU81_CEPFO|nr:LOW QUALITY PROTEIN: XS domain-containing protein [Cephalotus follicularis]